MLPMPYCPRCKESFAGELTTCPKCSYDFDKNGTDTDEHDWILIARIFDKTSADYAEETLKSYGVPAVILSESGFFGQVGLNLPSVSGKGYGKFQIHVPAIFRQEAEDVLNMILGEEWEHVE
jgi:hypothetical protein